MMAMSSEYPDLKWVPPKSWTNANRTSVQLIVVHDTEGSSHAMSAEDGAAYNARRDDGTSAHYFHDNNSTVQGVRTEDIAHTARRQGNLRGIHHELCARASFTRERWLSPDYGLPMLKMAARQAARDVKKWGIPVRKLTAGQVADGMKGFCGHADITKAFPQDNGTHTDPGPNFPWPEFLDMVRAELTPKENAMPSAEEVAQKTAALLGPTLAQLLLAVRQSANAVQQVRQAADAYSAADAERDALMASLIGKVDDELYAHLRGGSPEATAAVLRAVLGDQAAEVGRLLAAA